MISPLPVAARSKVCDLSLTGIAFSNPAGVMDVCVLSGRGLRADHSSSGVIPAVLCLSMIVELR